MNTTSATEKDHGYEPSAVRDCSAYQFRYASLSELEFNNKKMAQCWSNVRYAKSKKAAARVRLLVCQNYRAWNMPILRGV